MPTIGRIVLYTYKVAERLITSPAIIVSVNSGTSVNLTVFPDWSNHLGAELGPFKGMFWATSVMLNTSADPIERAWQWPQMLGSAGAIGTAPGGNAAAPTGQVAGKV